MSRHSPEIARKSLKGNKLNGGPGEIRTLDLFHAMEARSQLRHRPTKGRLATYSAYHGVADSRARRLAAVLVIDGVAIHPRQRSGAA